MRKGSEPRVSLDPPTPSPLSLSRSNSGRHDAEEDGQQPAGCLAPPEPPKKYRRQSLYKEFTRKLTVRILESGLTPETSSTLNIDNNCVAQVAWDTLELVRPLQDGLLHDGMMEEGPEADVATLPGVGLVALPPAKLEVGQRDLLHVHHLVGVRVQLHANHLLIWSDITKLKELKSDWLTTTTAR